MDTGIKKRALEEQHVFIVIVQLDNAVHVKCPFFQRVIYRHDRQAEGILHGLQKVLHTVNGHVRYGDRLVLKGSQRLRQCGLVRQDHSKQAGTCAGQAKDVRGIHTAVAEDLLNVISVRTVAVDIKQLRQIFGSWKIHIGKDRLLGYGIIPKERSVGIEHEGST